MDALIDSAEFRPELGSRRLRLGHDVLRWRGRLRPGQLDQRVRQLGAGTAPNRRALRELVALNVLRQAGDGERRLGRLLSRFEPEPEPQVWVTPHRCVDWYFRDLRYAYEYQGSVDHATADGRASDAARDLELRREGIRVGYLTAGDLDDGRTVLATVAGTLAARADELGTTPPTLRPG